MKEKPTTKQKAEIQQRVGDLLINSVDEFLSAGRSPVTGGKFKTLSKDYSKEKKHGNRNPNLYLTGKMRDKLKFTPTNNGIEFGIFNKKEAKKADNHNKNSSESLKTNVPQRQFIPLEQKGIRGSFEKSIRTTIDKIISDVINGS